MDDSRRLDLHLNVNIGTSTQQVCGVEWLLTPHTDADVFHDMGYHRDANTIRIFWGRTATTYVQSPRAPHGILRFDEWAGLCLLPVVVGLNNTPQPLKGSIVFVSVIKARKTPFT